MADGDRLVRARIEDLDDLAFDFDAIRDVDNVAKHVADLLGHRGLAVSRRAIEKNRTARIDGWADLLDEFIGNHHIRENRCNGAAIDTLVGDGLAGHPIAIGSERHRRGPDVLVERHRVLRPDLAFLGQGVTKFRHRPNARGAQHIDEFALLGLIEQLLNGERRQLQQFDKYRRPFDAVRVHRFGHQVQEIG